VRHAPRTCRALLFASIALSPPAPP
jgi:hypothetical protein